MEPSTYESATASAGGMTALNQPYDA
jgi:hypothetical protein